jgi:hypothetical protein
MQWWHNLKERWADLLAEYGRVAFGTYLVLWISVLALYAVAITMGMEVDGAAETSGVLFGSWVAAKVTQPARIAATIVLTPMVARVIRRAPASAEE